jgi:cytochrome P450
MFENFFLNLGGDATIRAQGRASGDELMKYLRKVVAARKPVVATATAMPENVMDRFIFLQTKYPQILDDERIAANVCGIIAGAVVTVEKVVANVMDVLLDPKWDDSVWAGAVTAAANDDSDALWLYYHEALRFRPQGAAIARVVTQDVTVNGVLIPAKTLVLNAHTSAMKDPAAFPTPEQIILEPGLRDREKYMHFGWHRYQCLGKYMAPVEITEMMRALLRLPRLRRGTDSKLIYKGQYPENFVLEFDV